MTPGGRGALALDDVVVNLGGKRLVGPLSLTIRPGEVVAIMGPSGSGKSTLLAAISGALDPRFAVAGCIRLGDRVLPGLPPERRGVGLLFQDDLLFPHMSVAENLLFAVPGQIRDRHVRRARVAAALAEAELPGFGDRAPTSLSGGQRARISLMRTLLAEPRALLLDEPFSRLDTELRHRFRAFVFTCVRERGLPCLLVTHDPADAEAAGGRLLEIGAPE